MNKPVCFSDMTHLIAGCGDIGLRLAIHLNKSGARVCGIVRSESSVEQLYCEHIHAVQTDLSNPAMTIMAKDKPLFYFAPPPAAGSKDTTIRGFLSHLAAHHQIPSKIVYISTTGVYGDCEGRWINEDEPLKPKADRSLRRLDAEQALTNFAEKQQTELVILRVAGIYGPGKLPLARLSQNLPVVRNEDSPFTNRIHADDLVTICETAMLRARHGSIYNVSDGEPGTMADYFSEIAKRAGMSAPPQISLKEAASQLSPGMMSYMRESRRLDNQRLLNELKIELNYPNLQKGLDSCF